ncbi:hypothetical protein L7F22_054243 [Adiantum nelumboides]|nr:hypothetical protein [Adiantum nelumboides]
MVKYHDKEKCELPKHRATVQALERVLEITLTTTEKDVNPWAIPLSTYNIYREIGEILFEARIKANQPELAEWLATTSHYHKLARAKVCVGLDSTNMDMQKSKVSANEFLEWVETDDCMHSCGIDRQTVGILSDALVEKGFVKALCFAECQQGYPNVVDLFEKLAAGEGSYQLNVDKDDM